MFPDHINWSLLFCSILNSFSSYLQCAIVINKIGQNLLLALEMKLIYPLDLDLEWTHVISLRIFLANLPSVSLVALVLCPVLMYSE